jgi:RNA-directed DNA polymerase
VDAIAQALHHGHTQVIDADLSKYFDSIPHAKLLAVVAERIVDGAMLHLIKLWLKAPVIGEEEGQGGKRVRKNVGGGKANSRGTPQGGVISPLLANCYLHLLDRIWERQQLPRKLQARIVRYADDFVVLCKGNVDAPLAWIRQVLDRLDLQLNETKTQAVDARQNSFNFLGFAIRVSKSWRSGKRYIHVCPSAPSLAKIKARLKQQTRRDYTPIRLDDIVRNMNTSLRGWVNYFRYRNSRQAFEKVRVHAEERLRTHLMKRHRVKDRDTALKRFPRSLLYTRYGLYLVPSTTGWKAAHASV